MPAGVQLRVYPTPAWRVAACGHPGQRGCAGRTHVAEAAMAMFKVVQCTKRRSAWPIVPQLELATCDWLSRTLGRPKPRLALAIIEPDLDVPSGIAAG
jgi:hypothetical protein